jgi:hypothetical protein
VAASKVNVSDYSWDALAPKVSSAPNMICVGVLAGGGCNQDLYVDFTKPVRKLKFVGVGVQDSGTVAVAHLFAGATELGQANITGQGTDTKPAVADLSAYTGVTRLEVVMVTDAAGLEWDDFEFEVSP